MARPLWGGLARQLSSLSFDSAAMYCSFFASVALSEGDPGLLGHAGTVRQPRFLFSATLSLGVGVKEGDS